MTIAKRMSEETIRVLYDLAIYNCQHFGTYTQLIFETPTQARQYSNIDVAREATKLAAGLRKLDISAGDRVIVILPNCPEVIIAYQAIARSGALIIPVLPVLKAPEIRYIAENSRAKAIITSSALLPLLLSAVEKLPLLQTLVVTDLDHSTEATDHLPQLLPYTDVVAIGANQVDYYLTDLPGVLPSENNTAAILYTSGTTGRPKGVMLSHKNLVANAISGHSTAPSNERAGKQLAVLPLAHAFGILTANVSYLAGATIVMHQRFDPKAVLADIERHSITSFAGVPAMFVALLNTPGAEQYDTSSLEYCVSGSAPLPVSVLERFEQLFHCQIREGYGLSESSAALTGHAADIEVKPGTVGKALPGIELQIVDELGQPLPAGEIGEVIARGPNIMQGYYDMPDETRVALRNGWLYSGDMGSLDEDGYLTIVERKKDLIIRGGFNIYPRDVEEVLNRHPAVIEAAVIGVPSERMGEEVKAFVSTREPVTAEELIAFCQQHLANYKTPSQVEFVNALPRNNVGKIDKKILRAK